MQGNYLFSWENTLPAENTIINGYVRLAKAKVGKISGITKAMFDRCAYYLYFLRLFSRLLHHCSSNFTQESIKSNTIPISSKSNPRSQSPGIIKRTVLTILKMIFVYIKNFSIEMGFMEKYQFARKCKYYKKSGHTGMHNRQSSFS